MNNCIGSVAAEIGLCDIAGWDATVTINRYLVGVSGVPIPARIGEIECIQKMAAVRDGGRSARALQTLRRPAPTTL